jgi:2-polyprenyl-3-methyl-5-hydroxy-6-metoxy-1,4-benzoquinol methylase
MALPTTACLVCRGPTKALAEGQILCGGTTRADKLYPFALAQCDQCGHIQKLLNADWHAAMDGLYERHYEDYRVVGRQVNFVNGKIVDRDGLAVRKLDSLIGLGPRGAVLDIGCGSGRFLRAFSELKSSWTIAGYDVGDLHREMVCNISGALFFHGKGALKKISQRFDLITLNHVVEHLAEPVVVLREAAQLLKDGGRLVVRVPSFEAVNTDFFLMEHCSHFTQQTLRQALALAGLEIVQAIDDLSAIEVGVIAMEATGDAPPAPYNAQTIRDKALQCLAWAQSLPGFIRRNAAGRKVGILGVGGAGLWLGVFLRGEISFYVDEDPGKQGQEFAGCPILPGKSIPKGAIVFVTFNNPEASRRMCERLRGTFPDTAFMAPPAVL